ncbi:MAG: hypothetical protein C4321_08015, partial [Chloroflexota bacterium]
MALDTQSFFIRSVAPGLVFSATLAGLVGASVTPQAKAPTGEQIYRQRCAVCHGAKGEGTKQYSRVLAGERSVGELAEFIARSMPPGAAKKLPSAEARKVAAY